jgi:hypothetical protein
MHAMETDSSAGDLGGLGRLRPFAEVARSLPPSRAGKPVHVSTIGRWRSPGVRRRDGSYITLRAVRLPAGWATTAVWVEAFIAAVTAEKSGRAAPPSTIRTTARRRREIERANRELDDIGI